METDLIFKDESLTPDLFHKDEANNFT